MSQVQLKTYQQNALKQLDRWLDALKATRKDTADTKKFYASKGKTVSKDLANFPCIAWKSLKGQGVLPGIPRDGNITIPEYISRYVSTAQPEKAVDLHAVNSELLDLQKKIINYTQKTQQVSKRA